MNQLSSVLDERARVLFVDDDLILAGFAKAHLSTPVITVESSANGEEAWRRLCGEPFDLVLLDTEMPVLDGFGLLEKLRAEPQFEHLPVVMLTGREDVLSIERSLQLGAHSFVTKPLNWRTLSYALRYVLRAARVEADLRRRRQRSEALSQLTNNLLSLIRLESRTPLDAIIGYSNCISQQIDGPVSAESYLGYAEQIGLAARQMQDRFMELIQYAQLSSGHATLAHDEYEVCALLDVVAASLAAAGPSKRIVVKKPQESLSLICDRHWLTRALAHLLEDVLGREEVKSVELGAAQAAEGNVAFSVVTRGAFAPDGGQISAGRQAPPGYSLESVRIEHGLGIPFARRIAELHDGNLVEVRRGDSGAFIEMILPKCRVLEAARPVLGAKVALVA